MLGTGSLPRHGCRHVLPAPCLHLFLLPGRQAPKGVSSGPSKSHCVVQPQNRNSSGMASRHLDLGCLLLSPPSHARATVDEPVSPLIPPSPEQCHPKKPCTSYVGESLAAPSLCHTLSVTHRPTTIAGAQ